VEKWLIFKTCPLSLRTVNILRGAERYCKPAPNANGLTVYRRVQDVSALASDRRTGALEKKISLTRNAPPFFKG